MIVKVCIKHDRLVISIIHKFYKASRNFVISITCIAIVVCGLLISPATSHSGMGSRTAVKKRYLNSFKIHFKDTRRAKVGCLMKQKYQIYIDTQLHLERILDLTFFIKVVSSHHVVLSAHLLVKVS